MMVLMTLKIFFGTDIAGVMRMMMKIINNLMISAMLKNKDKDFKNNTEKQNYNLSKYFDNWIQNFKIFEIIFLKNI